ncbi:methyl-accepting chemotaxis protein [Paenibacillus arenilitoris]|uniref:Methyl-accepting chemotaxis protein n=1 Tax=Paenibacillus arenilitoris TaxID=2772299 RepID=A0A927CNG4_9BACL|nr:methyl-accepting chemotaxis protein [Paenibacillus arenilitoris]MBD2870097.1 methyl-accepting chemotaxis protein [Paenibacillus arenilitoris]
MRLSLRWRMILLAAVPLAFYAFSGFYLLGEQRKVAEQMTKEIYETTNAIDSLILNADRDLYQAFQEYLKVESGTLDETNADAARAELEANIKQADERIAEAKRLIETNGLQHLAYGETERTIEQILTEFKSTFDNWTVAAAKAAADGVSRFEDRQINNNFDISRSGLDEVGASMDSHTKLKMAEIKRQMDETRTTTFIAILVISLALAAAVFLTVHLIMKTVRSVIGKTNKVAEGDLTVQPDAKYGKDELGHISISVDSMIENMRALIAEIAACAGEVGQTSSQLATAAAESASAARHVTMQIQDVAAGSEVQARGAKESSKVIEEMAIGIQNIALNTCEIAERSMSTSHQAGQGQAALDRLIDQMNEAKAVIGKLSETIATLESRSQEIGAIAENITSFSNQTNILSLNASIEAARAGEHGKGFAVVAGEIRKLAASSLASADGIHKLVEETRGEIKGASAYMAQTAREMEKGGDRVKDVHLSLNAIAASIVKMNEQAHENSAITQQMSASSEQVSASMEQAASGAAVNLEKTESVAAATEEQLAHMDNISASASRLSEIVSKLELAISRFELK